MRMKKQCLFCMSDHYKKKDGDPKCPAMVLAAQNRPVLCGRPVWPDARVDVEQYM